MSSAQKLGKTNPDAAGHILFLDHKCRLVRSYSARLLGLDTEGQVEQYLEDILVRATARRRLAVPAMCNLADEWTM